MKPKPKKPPDPLQSHLFSSCLPFPLSLSLHSPIFSPLCSICRFPCAPYPVFTAFKTIFVRYCGSLDEGKSRLDVTLFHNRDVQRWTDSCDEATLVQIYVGQTAGHLALRFSGHVFWTHRCVFSLVLCAYGIITTLEILTIAYVKESLGITCPMIVITGNRFVIDPMLNLSIEFLWQFYGSLRGLWQIYSCLYILAYLWTGLVVSSLLMFHIAIDFSTPYPRYRASFLSPDGIGPCFIEPLTRPCFTPLHLDAYHFEDPPSLSVYKTLHITFLGNIMDFVVWVTCGRICLCLSPRQMLVGFHFREVCNLIFYFSCYCFAFNCQFSPRYFPISLVVACHGWESSVYVFNRSLLKLLGAHFALITLYIRRPWFNGFDSMKWMYLISLVLPFSPLYFEALADILSLLACMLVESDMMELHPVSIPARTQCIGTPQRCWNRSTSSTADLRFFKGFKKNQAISELKFLLTNIQTWWSIWLVIKVLGRVTLGRCAGQSRLDVCNGRSSAPASSVVSVLFLIGCLAVMYCSFNVMFRFYFQMALPVMFVVDRVQCITSHPVNCIYGCCTPSVIICNSSFIRVLEQHSRVLGLCPMALDVHPWMLSPAHYGCCLIRWCALLHFIDLTY